MQKIVIQNAEEVKLCEVSFDSGYIIYIRKGSLYRLVKIDNEILVSRPQRDRYCFVEVNNTCPAFNHVGDMLSISVELAIKEGLTVNIVNYKEFLEILGKLKGD